MRRFHHGALAVVDGAATGAGLVLLSGVLIAHHSICGSPPRGTGRKMKELGPPKRGAHVVPSLTS